jgi:signal transduction histidine kinase
MGIYDFVSKLRPFRKKYALKYFLIIVPVVLLPLVALVILAIATHIKIVVIGASVVVVFTILAAILVYKLFSNIVVPLQVARHTINMYVNNGKLPTLTNVYDDEAGRLLEDIYKTLEEIDFRFTEKSDMIDLLSHDLRAPVARIMGLSNLIKLDDETPKEEYADLISEECRNVLSLMENILMMFKEDVSAFEPQIVNLRGLLIDTVSFFNIAAADKNLKVEVDVDDSVYINVQYGLIKQAVRNILGNAIKFSSEGKRITITSKEQNDQVAITIRDEGMGLEKGDLQKIFERFTSSGKKGTKGETSIGLGLYLSKKIIEKQGGKISAESEGVNKGATFTITLFQLITKKRKIS